MPNKNLKFIISSATDKVAQEIGQDMFGAIYNAHNIGAGQHQNFEADYDKLGLSHVRFADGTMSERKAQTYTLENSGDLTGTGQWGFEDAAALALENGGLLSVIIPTLRYFRNADGTYSEDMKEINESDDELNMTSDWKLSVADVMQSNEINLGFSEDLLDSHLTFFGEGERHLWSFLEEYYIFGGEHRPPLLLEIGNEFHLQQGFSENPAAYGAIADHFLDVIRIFKKFHPEADMRVALQTGDSTNSGIWWKQADGLIRGQISKENYDVLTDISHHIFSTGVGDVTNGPKRATNSSTNEFQRLAEMHNDWGDALEKDVGLYVSAWNVSKSGFQVSQDLSPQAAALAIENLLNPASFIESGGFGPQASISVLEHFSNMASIGVDAAALWTLQGNGVGTSQRYWSSRDPNGDTYVNAKGHTMSLLSQYLNPSEQVEEYVFRDDISGIGAFPKNDPFANLANWYLFESEGSAVIFLATSGKMDDGEILNVDLFFESSMELMHAHRLSSSIGARAEKYLNTGKFGVSKEIWDLVDDNFEAQLYAEYSIHNLTDGVTAFEVDSSNEDNSVALSLPTAGSFEIFALRFDRVENEVAADGSQPVLPETSEEQETSASDPTGGTLLENAEVFEGVFIKGSVGDDSLEGTNYNDSLKGLNGDDYILGHGGDDILPAADGDDTIDGGSGNDKLGGGRGNDVLMGGLGDDTGGAGPGHDVVYAGSGDDIFSAGWGTDTVYGEAGNDRLAGSFGTDLVYGGTGNDRIGGGEGNDTIFGEDGSDTIGAGDDADEVSGGAGSDFVGGGAGNDTLFGNEGNDTLVGGRGDDALSGGDGEDIFVFNSLFMSGDIDRIVDFDASNDVVRLVGRGQIDSATDLPIMNDVVRGRDGKVDVEISWGNGKIFLENVSINDLSSENFDM